MIKGFAATSAIFALTAAPTVEAATPLLQPVPYGIATIRHYQGRASIAIKGRNGSVEIAPLPMDHGCVNFGITVFNASNRSADINLHDVTIFVGDAPVDVLTIAQLEKRAKTRAFWTSMAVGAVSGLAAGVVAASNSHATIRSSGRYGTHITKISYHDGSGAANGAMISAGGIAAAGSIQENGRRQAAAIEDEILALTTVDPGNAYGGRVVIDKIKAPLPQTIMVSVSWNGEVYTSKWQIVPEGTPAPSFNEAPVAETAFAPRAAVIQAAMLATEPKAVLGGKTTRPVSTRQPKQYPHDDTVQVPM